MLKTLFNTDSCGRISQCRL